MAKATKTKANGPDELKGWQQIASFLGQPVSVAQRWTESGMPVEKRGRYVYSSRRTQSLAGARCSRRAGSDRDEGDRSRRRTQARHNRSFEGKTSKAIRSELRNFNSKCAPRLVLSASSNQHLPAVNGEV
jgi:hypothetical protein